MKPNYPYRIYLLLIAFIMYFIFVHEDPLNQRTNIGTFIAIVFGVVIVYKFLYYVQKTLLEDFFSGMIEILRQPIMLFLLYVVIFSFIIAYTVHTHTEKKNACFEAEGSHLCGVQHQEFYQIETDKTGYTCLNVERQVQRYAFAPEILVRCGQ